jgi:tetratricopeptide (TPR) repeat protein
MKMLAQNQAAMGKPEARETARQALDAFSKSLGPSHSVTQRATPVLQQIAASAVPGPASAASAAALMAQIREGKAVLEARDPRRAADLLKQAAESAHDVAIPELESLACGLLALALSILGQRDEALVRAHRALAIAEHEREPSAGFIEDLRDVIQRMESAASPPGDPGGPDWNARIGAALERARAGDADAAFQALVEIAEQARAAAAPGPEASARIFLGQILLARGERALARAELLTALGIAEKLGDEGAAAHVRALLAQAGEA